jgi:hypothetical protein
MKKKPKNRFNRSSLAIEDELFEQRLLEIQEILPNAILPLRAREKGTLCELSVWSQRILFAVIQETKSLDSWLWPQTNTLRELIDSAFRSVSRSTAHRESQVWRR